MTATVNEILLKKPNKKPPPPPSPLLPPPRNSTNNLNSSSSEISNTQIYLVTQRPASECFETVRSTPICRPCLTNVGDVNQFLQAFSNLNFLNNSSSRCESSSGLHSSIYDYSRPCGSSKSEINHRHHFIVTLPPVDKYSKPLPPLPTSHGNDTHVKAYETRSLNRNFTKQDLEQQRTIITPKQRATRPRLCLSPQPQLKKDSENVEHHANSFKFQKCKSLHYRRFMEQNFERLFKYIEEREKRRLKCLTELVNNNLDIQECQKKILTMLYRKETMYLRSLRAKMNVNNFERLKFLGEGYMGKVFLVRRKDDERDVLDSADQSNPRKPELYAMKKLEKTNVLHTGQMHNVIVERDVLVEVDNEWIVKLYYSFQDKESLYFILEYIPGGDMMTLLQNENVFTEDWARFYTAEISLAVQFVHDMGFIHRDIKPDNILIDKTGHIKLTDFGLCTGFNYTHDPTYYLDETINNNNNNNYCIPSDNDQSLIEHPTITGNLRQRHMDYSRSRNNQRQSAIVGSENYMAPEVVLQNYTKLCDWWSIGIILYEMVAGSCPQPICRIINPRQPEQEFRLLFAQWKSYLNYEPFENNGRTYIISPDAIDLIEGLLSLPESRLCQNGIKDIQNHGFFRKVDWKNIRTDTAPYIPHLDGDLDTRHFKTPELHSEPRRNLFDIKDKDHLQFDFTRKSFFRN